MTAYPSVPARIEAAARRDPAAPALATATGTLTYGRLLDVTDELAAFLTARVAAGECVAISLPKSATAVVLMVACLRAGVPYVPIDPGAPAARRETILRDCDPRLLFGVAADWPDESFTAVPITTTDGEADGAVEMAERRATADPWLTETGTAYVLYTSGSTGVPKGVAISATNAAYFVDWASRAFPLSAADQVAQHAPLHFDLPVYDLFVGLAAGACVHLLDAQTVLFPGATYRFLRDRRITALYAVPSALNAMVRRSPLATAGLPDLRQLLYAGEEYHVPQLRQLVAALPAETVIANLYGPVETNVITWHRVDAPTLAGDRVPIGRAAEGSDVRVRTDAGELLAEPGAEGEIVVSGPSVSPGYLGDAERTAATRLVDDAGTWYRTGDFGHFGAGGVVHFHGRRDGMVKTRGYRVELGDVEAAIAAHPLVAEVGVCPVAHETAGTLLEAHVVPADGAEITPAEVKAWLTASVPAYMVPAVVHLRSELPHTSTGKIARGELSAAVR